MKFVEALFETRKATLNYLKSLVPSWPDYVVRDLVYNWEKKDPTKALKYLDEFAENLGYQEANEIRWELKTVTLTLDSFDDQTIHFMKMRKFGSSNIFGIPRDQERNLGARERLLKNGPSKEPIILVKKGDKYELVEGWHRTSQSLLLWPKGYRQAAYITKDLHEQ